MEDLLRPLADDLISYCGKHMGFQDPPSLFLQDDEKNANNVFGKTAFYNPSEQSISIFTTNRHPKDILRSIAHELVHHKQNLKGMFDNVTAAGPGYAQEDPHLRNMEKQAYLVGNMAFRDWEDSLKKKNKEKGIMIKIVEAFNKKGEQKMLKENKRKIIKEEETPEKDTTGIVETEGELIDEEDGGTGEEFIEGGMPPADPDNTEESVPEHKTPEWEKLIDKNRFNSRRERLFKKLMKSFIK